MKSLCADVGGTSGRVVGEGLSGEVAWSRVLVMKGKQAWRDGREGGMLFVETTASAQSQRQDKQCEWLRRAKLHRILQIVVRILDLIPSATGSHWCSGRNQLITCTHLKDLSGHREG